MITFSRENERLLQNLKKVSPETYYHSIRVKTLTLDMLRYINKLEKDRFSQEEIDIICKGALLHDIGKLFVRNYILTKSSRLTSEEMAAMSMHTKHGGEALQDDLSEEESEIILAICLNHHERVAPEAEAEGKVPLYVQIVSICDAYDALTSDRVYHNRFTKDQALAMIEAGECGNFNPFLRRCLREITANKDQ